MYTKRGPELAEGAELLLRQIFPDWLKDEGVPSSQSFQPWRTIDDGCLSVDRGSLTTATKAFATRTWMDAPTTSIRTSPRHVQTLACRARTQGHALTSVQAMQAMQAS